MGSIILSVLAVGGISAVTTIILGKVAPSARVLTLLPAALCLIISFYYYYLSSISRGEGFQDLGYFLLSIFLMAGAFFGVLTALIMKYRDYKKK